MQYVLLFYSSDFVLYLIKIYVLCSGGKSKTLSCAERPSEEDKNRQYSLAKFSVMQDES